MFLVNNATPAIAASVYCFSTLGGKSSVSVTSSPIESKSQPVPLTNDMVGGG